MSENWRVQLSLKIENHLLNIRADTFEEFTALLARVEEHKEPIALVIASYAPQKPDRPAPAATPAPAPSRSQGATSGETGPVGINGIDTTSTKKDGTRMKSPKYTVHFSNGKKLSTFDALVADAARELQGGLCYYTTVQNGDYVNLGTVWGAAS